MGFSTDTINILLHMANDEQTWANWVELRGKMSATDLMMLEMEASKMEREHGTVSAMAHIKNRITAIKI